MTYVEYIENLNNQMAYIDTGYKPDYYTKIEVVVEETHSNIWPRILGSGVINETTSVLVDIENDELYYKPLGFISFVTGTFKPTKNEKHTYVIENNCLYFDGRKMYDYSLAGQPYKSSKNLYLYTYPNGSGIGQYEQHFIGRMYSCKLWQNGELVGDFKPAVNDGVAGMFDTVTGTFHTSPNSYSFVAGPATFGPDKNEIKLSKFGGEETFTIGGDSWTIVGYPDWLTITPMSGEDGDEVTVSAPKNYIQREGEIMIEGAGGEEASVTVTQKAVGIEPPIGRFRYGSKVVYKIGDTNKTVVNDTTTYQYVSQSAKFEVSTDSIELYGDKLDETIAVTTNAEWDAATDADWLTLTKNGNELVITATELEEEAEATIRVYTTGYFAGLEAEIAVTYSTASYYLEATGYHSYWATDYIPNANTKIEIKWQRDSEPSGWNHIFGARRAFNASGSFDGYFATQYQNNKNLGVSFDGRFEDRTGMMFVAGQQYVMTLGRGKYTANGQEYNTGENFTEGSNLALWIGAVNHNNSVGDDTLDGKVWYFKVWDGDTLVRHYVPNEDLNFHDKITGHIATLHGSARYGS